jgi:hypothetical protein
MYMSFWDRFKPQAPTTAQTQIADSQKDKDKTVAAAGSVYYVKWTNAQCTMSDTVKFYNEHERDIFIDDCRHQGYYISTWHESRDKQVAEAIEQIKAELIQVQEQEINRYKYLYAERNADYIHIKARYENALHELEVIQAAQQQEQEQKAPAQTKSAAAILQELQADIKIIMSTHNTDKLDEYAAEYAAELQQVKKKIPLQGRLVLAMIARQINSI